MRIERVFGWIFFLLLGFWLLQKMACSGCHDGGFGFGRGEKGSGNIVSQPRAVGPFSEIEVNGVIDVRLRQGSESAVEIRTSDNLQQGVLTEIRGNRLVISMKDDFRYHDSGEMKAIVTVAGLRAVDFTGVGHLSCETPIVCDRFSLNFSGVGSMELQGTCHDATFQNTGTGSLDAGRFICKKVELDNTGVGSARVHADEEITINATGVGSVEWSGTAQVRQQNSSGIGSIKKVD